MLKLTTGQMFITHVSALSSSSNINIDVNHLYFCVHKITI